MEEAEAGVRTGRSESHNQDQTDDSSEDLRSGFQLRGCREKRRKPHSPHGQRPVAWLLLYAGSELLEIRMLVKEK